MWMGAVTHIPIISHNMPKLPKMSTCIMMHANYLVLIDLLNQKRFSNSVQNLLVEFSIVVIMKCPLPNLDVY